MSFSDIFKKSFLDGYSGADITPTTAAITLLIACAVAFYIFLVYRVVTRKTFYSKNFGVSLAGIAVITAAIILTIQSSIVVSLGMVGALSIVRFRTAIKDPMDLMFLFWSIGAGIICGVGLAEIAVILSVLITIGILVLDRLPVAKAPMILVVNSDSADAENEIVGKVKEFAKHFKVKSRNIRDGRLDMIIELRTAEGSELIKGVTALDCVTSASLLEHDGEVTF